MRVNNSTTFASKSNGEAIKPNEAIVTFEYTELEAESAANPECIRTIETTQVALLKINEMAFFLGGNRNGTRRIWAGINRTKRIENMTQIQLANKLNVVTAAASKWERFVCILEV